MSLYIQRENGQPTHHLRRYTLRLDGFASVNAPYGGGEMVTKPLVFDPPADADSNVQLVLNYATAAVGGIRCELQDEAGKPVVGYAIEDCKEMVGDRIAGPVSWRGRSGLKALAGRPIRIRFHLKDADLYAIRFAPGRL